MPWCVCHNWQTNIDTLQLTKLQNHSNFNHFSTNVFYSVSEFHSGYPTAFSHPVSWYPLFCDNFLIFLCFGWLTVLRNTNQIFCRLSFNFRLSDVFLIDWSYWFDEEGHKGEVPFSSHHTRAIWYQHDLSMVMLTLITGRGSIARLKLLNGVFILL